MRPRGVGEVVEAIVSYLKVRRADESAVALLLDRLRDVGSCVDGPPVPPRHNHELTDAVTRMCVAEDEQLAEVGRSIRSAAEYLAWKVDDGQYYSSRAPVGDSYRHGNMHSILAEGDDFVMGLFLLVPAVDYLDHRHEAPEFYLNLTGPSLWRFDFGDWIEMPAGSVVWNGQGQVHATRTGSASWLSLWAWLRDIDQLCEVMEAPSSR
ncbi:MAG: hypothetical protein GY708_20250 [Actinomycetia bacterium]|nr:hypothetical protein [Actinomycetes bacterium]